MKFVSKLKAFNLLNALIVHRGCGINATTPLKLFGGEILVYLSYELVSIGSVNHASRLYRLTSCGGAAETVHTDLKEELCGIGIEIENVANDRILGYNHSAHPFRENLLISQCLYK